MPGHAYEEVQSVPEIAGNSEIPCPGCEDLEDGVLVPELQEVLSPERGQVNGWRVWALGVMCSLLLMGGGVAGKSALDLQNNVHDMDKRLAVQEKVIHNTEKALERIEGLLHKLITATISRGPSPQSSKP